MTACFSHPPLMQQQPPKAQCGRAFLVYICSKSNLISVPGQLGHKEQRGTINTLSPCTHTYAYPPVKIVSISGISFALSQIADSCQRIRSKAQGLWFTTSYFLKLLIFDHCLIHACAAVNNHNMATQWQPKIQVDSAQNPKEKHGKQMK